MQSLQFLIVLYLPVCITFEKNCPEPAERYLRASAFCNKSSISTYSCLYDENKREIVETCTRKADIAPPGNKFVLRGLLDYTACSTSRFQPIHLWSNVSSQCIFKKSQCVGEGAFLYKNDTAEFDRSCRCDYTNGYAFITKPKQPCFCIPSEEECSCYKKYCPKNTILTPDYNCASEDELKRKEVYSCPIIVHYRLYTESITINGNRLIVKELTTEYMEYSFRLISFVLTAIGTVLIVQGFLVLLCYKGNEQRFPEIQMELSDTGYCINTDNHQNMEFVSELNDIMKSEPYSGSCEDLYKDDARNCKICGDNFSTEYVIGDLQKEVQDTLRVVQLGIEKEAEYEQRFPEIQMELSDTGYCINTDNHQNMEFVSELNDIMKSEPYSGSCEDLYKDDARNCKICGDNFSTEYVIGDLQKEVQDTLRVVQLGIEKEAEYEQRLLQSKEETSETIYFTNTQCNQIMETVSEVEDLKEEKLFSSSCQDNQSLSQIRSDISETRDDMNAKLASTMENVLEFDDLMETQKYSCACQDLHKLQVRAWKQHNASFGSKAVICDVLKQIQDSSCVALVGTEKVNGILHHIALEFVRKNEHFVIIPCQTPVEIVQHYELDTCRHHMFILEDACGCEFPLQQSVKDLIDNDTLFRYMLQERKTKILISFTPGVFWNMNFHNSELFFSNHFKLLSTEI